MKDNPRYIYRVIKTSDARNKIFVPIDCDPEENRNRYNWWLAWQAMCLPLPGEDGRCGLHPGNRETLRIRHNHVLKRGAVKRPVRLPAASGVPS